MRTLFSRCARLSAAAVLLMAAWQPLAQAAESVTISRLQLRYGANSEDDVLGATASVYHRLPNELFFLQIYDREGDPDLTKSQERFELYVGRPFTWSAGARRFGWVGRVQKFSSDSFIPAVGLQLNLNRFQALSSPLKRYGIYSFVQLFAKEEEPEWGFGELLHYYAFGLGKNRVQVRGYNVFYFSDDDPVTLHAWADFIHPLHRHFDVYVRLNYLSDEHHWLGEDHLTGFLGARYNF